MYKSPIELIYQGVEMKIEKGIVKAVHQQDIIVDRDELIRALKYDRGQYEKGYADAMNSIVRCKECKHWRKELEPWYKPNHGYCVYCPQVSAESHFCSYGERKDNA